MPIIVNVKGFGEVEFPDGTSQKEIEAALKKFPKNIGDEENEIAKYQAQLAGAGLGAAYSFGVPAMQTIVGKAGEAYRGGVPPAGPAPTAGGASAAPAQTTVSPQAAASSTLGRQAPPMPPAGGSGTFNWGSRFGLSPLEAARAQEMGRNVAGTGAQNLIDIKAELEPKVQKLLPGAAQNRLGVYVPTRKTRESLVQEPGGSFRNIPPAQPISTGPSALERVTNLYRQMMESPIARGAGAAMRVAAPPLALASAFGQAHDIYTEQQKEEEERDRLTQALAAAGLLGTGMMMIPGGQIPGAALAIGAPAIQYAREKFR
jgi:hypothetical protein